MKNLTALLSLLLLPSLTFAQVGAALGTPGGLPQAAGVIQTGAPQYRADGATGLQIGDREGNTKEVLGHPEYTEPARRGKMFTLAANAYTIVATNASASPIGNAKPIVGFYNPLGSGVNAVLASARAYHTSGTSGGPLMWNFYCGQNWSPTASGTIYNDLLSNTTPNGSAMIAQNNTQIGTSPVVTSALNVLGVFGGPDNTALSSGGLAGHYEDLKGQIVVQPGCLIALMSTATGTSDVVSASLSWEEVAQ